MVHNTYTEEQQKWLFENAEKHENLYELTEKYNKVFGLNDSYLRIKSFCYGENLKTKNNFKNKKRDYTEEEINWLKENRCKFNNTRELTEKYNEKFDFKRSYDSIVRVCSEHKIRRNGYKEIIDNKEYDEWLKQNYNNYPTQEIVKIAKEKFGVDTTFGAIQSKLNRLGLKKEDRYKFFSKPIGDEYTYRQSVYVKVKHDKKAKQFQLNYRRKANVMYEKYYNTKIEDKKHIVVCIDQNINNFEKENLLLLTRDEYNRWRSKKQFYEFNDKKHNEVFLNLVRLETLVKKGLTT